MAISLTAPPNCSRGLWMTPYCVFIVFGKNPPCAIVRSCAFIKFGIFLGFFLHFLDFSSKFSSSIFPFLFQFDPFSRFLLCLVNYGYTSKKYTVHLFHLLHLLKFGAFPPCTFIPSCASNEKLGDLPPCVFIPACAFHMSSPNFFRGSSENFWRASGVQK